MADRPTRDGFGEGLLELGKTHPQVVALSGDLEDSARAIWFKKQYPDRFFSVGIAEQDMIGTAAGLALAGKIPFACSFSQFVTSKTLEQLRLAVCYQKLNVKVIGSHGGLSVGADGATAEALEEFAHMRSLPGMAVIVPCDPVEAKKATIAAADYPGPVFIRLGRAPVPTITKETEPYQIGQAVVMRPGDDVTIIACGLMVAHALQAAEQLAKAGRIMAAEPASLQLRFLQTLSEVATERNSTIIFPVPIDLIQAFMGQRAAGGGNGGAPPAPAASDAS